MSSPQIPPTPAPEITVNTPAAEIAAANTASQATEQPGGQPRNADGTFAPVAVAPPVPAAPIAPTPDNPVVTTDLGNGQVQVQYLTGETFKGTLAEVTDKIGRSHVTTKQWAQSEVAKAKQPPAPIPEPPPSRFENPQEEEVAKYTANLVAKTLGYPDADTMVRALGHIQDSTVDYSSQLTALQFQAKAPDFNPTPENNNKLFGVITESGISDEEFGTKTRDQQVQLMRQAHAYCLVTNQYTAKTASAPIRTAAPPPPPPTQGSQPLSTGGQIPPELMAQPGDSLDTIREKWSKAAALGLVEPRGR